MMTETQGCFLIGVLFMLVASQYKESFKINLAYQFTAAVWFVAGMFNSIIVWIK